MKKDIINADMGYECLAEVQACCLPADMLYELMIDRKIETVKTSEALGVSAAAARMVVRSFVELQIP